jgi:acyl-CoA thioester hydrolase
MGEIFVTTQKLRFCDTDRLGHVNNAIYNVMCEAGRAELMTEAGMLDRATQGLVIARMEMDFLREMNWPGTIRIETAIRRIGQRSLHVRQNLYQDDTLVAKATSVLVVIDIARRRAVPIADAWRAALERWLVPEF